MWTIDTEGKTWQETRLYCDDYHGEIENMEDIHRPLQIDYGRESLEPTEPHGKRVCRCIFHPASIEETKVLHCSDRVLMMIPHNIPNDTWELSLNQNQLVTVEDQLANLTDLHYLSLVHNSILFLEENAFQGLTSLVELDLSNNSLLDISYHKTIFSDLISLKILNLAFNHLTTIKEGTFDQLLKLEELYLNRNNMRSIQTGAFPALNSLNILTLNNNKLSNVHPQIFRLLSNLQTLNIGHNLLRVLPSDIFRGLKYLEILNMENCHLSVLDSNIFSGLYVNSLILDSNNIKWVPSSVLRPLANSLFYLSLSNNPLEALTPGSFKELSLLTDLIIRNMPTLEVIPENTFANLSGLSSLLLDHNPLLRHVSPGAFNGLEQLYVLRLDHNDLRHLEANVFIWADGVDQPRVYLGGNPWMCDCQVDWLIVKIQRQEDLADQWARSYDVDIRDFPDPGIADATEMVCAFPPELFGHRLEDLTPQQLTCIGDSTNVSSQASHTLTETSKEQNSSSPNTALWAFIGTFLGMIALTLLLNLVQRFLHWRAKYYVPQGLTGRSHIPLSRGFRRHRSFRRMSNDSTESMDELSTRNAYIDDESPCRL